jgi:hypothetical protein
MAYSRTIENASIVHALFPLDLGFYRERRPSVNTSEVAERGDLFLS